MIGAPTYQEPACQATRHAHHGGHSEWGCQQVMRCEGGQGPRPDLGW